MCTHTYLMFSSFGPAKPCVASTGLLATEELKTNCEMFRQLGIWPMYDDQMYAPSVTSYNRGSEILTRAKDIDAHMVVVFGMNPSTASIRIIGGNHAMKLLHPEIFNASRVEDVPISLIPRSEIPYLSQAARQVDEVRRNQPVLRPISVLFVSLPAVRETLPPFQLNLPGFDPEMAWDLDRAVRGVELLIKHLRLPQHA